MRCSASDLGTLLPFGRVTWNVRLRRHRPLVGSLKTFLPGPGLELVRLVSYWRTRGSSRRFFILVDIRPTAASVWRRSRQSETCSVAILVLSVSDCLFFTIHGFGELAAHMVYIESATVGDGSIGVGSPSILPSDPVLRFDVFHVAPGRPWRCAHAPGQAQ